MATYYNKKKVQAYIVGVALGDGNLSNPNGRAVRLRVTCDTQYPELKREIVENLQVLFPKNKVSTVTRQSTYSDVSVYSNKLGVMLPWKVGGGSKLQQNPHVPRWILSKKAFVKNCLRGLLQTDGSIYVDRGYTMVNFTNCIQALSKDVFEMFQLLGYKPKMYTILSPNRSPKYVVRLSKDTKDFIKEMDFRKR